MFYSKTILQSSRECVFQPRIVWNAVYPNIFTKINPFELLEARVLVLNNLIPRNMFLTLEACETRSKEKIIL